MNAPPRLSTIDQLKARDGDRCWLCDGKLDFAAEPNSKKAPTKEHLVAQANGGTDALDNLVLCHPGCNKQLGARPKADKEKMRAKRMAPRAKRVSEKAPSVKAAPINPKAAEKALAVHLTPSTTDWQRTAMIATASATFFAGLCVGMLIG